MFGVPKYSKALSALAEERGVQVSLNQNLVEVSHADRKAVFETDSGETITKDFDFLHVVPPQGPLNALKARMLSSRSVCFLPTLTDFALACLLLQNAPITDESGYVTVDQATLRHTQYPNIFALGDASSLPTSKTAAAVTAQTPVVVENLYAAMEGRSLLAKYDGYSE